MKPTKAGWWWFYAESRWIPVEIRAMGGKRPVLEVRIPHGYSVLDGPVRWFKDELWGPECIPPSATLEPSGDVKN